MFGFLERFLPPRSREAAAFIADEVGITSLTPLGRTDRLAWKDIRKVTIITTDQGPLSEDVFFVLEGIEYVIVVPHEQAVKIELLNYLQNLPGFDNEVVIRAMGCSDNDSFLCWTADG